MNQILFQPLRIKDSQLKNRMVMAPMTRNRADLKGVPQPMMAKYYAQRASAGLIITEATQVSATANGYMFTPGIYTDAQTEGWRAVTQAVHADGGTIFLQLWHSGRVSHTSLQPDGQAPVAPSAIPAATNVFTAKGYEPPSTPRALRTEEIPGIVRQFQRAAEMAKAAGFDGVEIHGANGYLIDQFLKDGSNQRSDGYGGNIAGRIRFALEVTEAVVAVWGPGKVGLRISPRGIFNDMHDSNPAAVFGALAEALNAYPLAFLHVLEPLPGHPSFKVQEGVAAITPLIRRNFRGHIILNGGYDKQSAETALQNNEADLVAFGVPYLANPDLPERYRTDAPLNAPDTATFYGGSEKGYTDYPYLNR
ncbi:MAG: alkene reductase [Desulfatitalea sp.]